MLKAENLTLNVDDEGGKKCLLKDISFQVDDGGDARDHRTKRRRKINACQNTDRNPDTGQWKNHT